MDIYYLCPCCGKKQHIINPLILGSSWQNEMYKCLEIYLKTLQDDLIIEWKPKKPKLNLQLDNFEGEGQKIPKGIQLIYVPPRERGIEKKKEKKLEEFEETETSDPAWKLWEKLGSYFKVGEIEDGETLNESMVKYRIGTWTWRGFTRFQCKEWLNVGFLPSEAELAEYCRDIEGIEPDDAVNYYSKEELQKKLNKHKGIEEEENEDTDRDG